MFYTYSKYRQDIRNMVHVVGKSINLAMSVRGLAALNQLGIGKHVAEEYGIPMYSRLIHTPSGETYPVPYGKKDECIYSVGMHHHFRKYNTYLANYQFIEKISVEFFS